MRRSPERRLYSGLFLPPTGSRRGKALAAHFLVNVALGSLLQYKRPAQPVYTSRAASGSSSSSCTWCVTVLYHIPPAGHALRGLT